MDVLSIVNVYVLAINEITKQRRHLHFQSFFDGLYSLHTVPVATDKGIFCLYVSYK